MPGAAGTEALVKDAKSLLACLLRMHASNEAVVFWNASREFKMMLRNDPVEPGVVAFDLCIVPDDDSDDEGDSEGGDPLRQVLELEHDGYDEDGMFVVEARSFPMDDLVARPYLLDDVLGRINAVWRYAVCKCNRYLIKDGAPTCLFCQLTHDVVADAAEHVCAICLERSPARHMVKQACCAQLLHARCLAVWTSSAGQHARCPLCRG